MNMDFQSVGMYHRLNASPSKSTTQVFLGPAFSKKEPSPASIQPPRCRLRCGIPRPRSEKTLADARMIRNRNKSQAVIENARAFKRFDNPVGPSPTDPMPRGAVPHSEWDPLFRDPFRFTGNEITGEFLLSTAVLLGALEPTCPVYSQIEQIRRCPADPKGWLDKETPQSAKPSKANPSRPDEPTSAKAKAERVFLRILEPALFHLITSLQLDFFAGPMKGLPLDFQQKHPGVNSIAPELLRDPPLRHR